MLIRCDHALGTDVVVPMELSLSDIPVVGFEGRIANCNAAGDDSGGAYDVGIEFVRLSDEGRETLNNFIAYCEALDYEARLKRDGPGGAGPDPAAGIGRTNSPAKRIKG